MAYVKFEHPASRYAVIGVAALVTVSGGTCTAAAVALGGLVPRPTRASSVEKALVGQAAVGRDDRQAAAARGSADLGDRHHRRPLCLGRVPQGVAPVWVKRALTAAARACPLSALTE